MQKYNGVFIIAVCAAMLSAFLAYQPRQVETLSRTLSQAAAAAPTGFQTVTAVWQETVAPAVTPAVPVNPAPQTGTPGRIIRIPAIRAASNYGWIQLPRGTTVDFVEAQRDGYIVRYDEAFVVIPRTAVEDGSVVLRKPRASIFVKS